MIIGSGTVAVKALIEIGGISELFDKYMNAIPSQVPINMTMCAAPSKHSFQLLRPMDDPEIPWLGFILGQTSASIWYFSYAFYILKYSDCVL